MSIFNGHDTPDNPLFFVSPTESIQGKHREDLEDWLKRVPGLQRVQVRIEDTSHTLFETTGDGVKRLFDILPEPEMKGFFIIRLGHQVKSTLLCPAT